MIYYNNITISKAIKYLENSKYKTLIFVNKNKTLIGTLTDGDLRRAILKGATFKSKINKYIFRNPYLLNKNDLNKKNIEKVFNNRELAISAIPVVNEFNKVIKVIYPDMISSITNNKKINLPIVIMAGGKGQRLAPFTSILPKPLAPVEDKTLLEQIMINFKEHKFEKFLISVNYKKEIIKAYFKDLKKFNIKFIEEKKYTGTVGSLKYMKSFLTSDFILTNCDIMLDINYHDLLSYHKKNKYDLTIVASKKSFKIPYGICEISKSMTLKKMIEKPSYDYLVNTGLYVLKKKLINILPRKNYVDMNDFLELLKKKNKKIGIYPVEEKSWIDVGQWQEYNQASKKFKNLFSKKN